MDSIENGATIRIGFKKYYDELYPTHFLFRIFTYSLKINKKTIFTGYCSGDEKSSNFFEVAEKITKEMNENKVDRYVIYPDESLEEGNNRWTSSDMDYVGNKLEKSFRDKLEELIGKPAINDFYGLSLDFGMED
ncbi:MAG: hypothetical protein WC812_00600 [Candidatus Pacearchaeota archaeon]|jgi:hypothetical protein